MTEGKQSCAPGQRVLCRKIQWRPEALRQGRCLSLCVGFSEQVAQFYLGESEPGTGNETERTADQVGVLGFAPEVVMPAFQNALEQTRQIWRGEVRICPG